MSNPKPEEISRSRYLLQNQYAHLDGDGNYSALPASRPQPLLRAQSFSELVRPRSGKMRHGNISFASIETSARALQNELWKHRHQLWPKRSDLRPIDILNPGVALEALGFRFEDLEPIGQYHKGRTPFEAAGIFDRDARKVQVSSQFSPEVKRFTAAHELGHAILHPGTGFHRDRPLDGSTISPSREPIETEANKFATYFLMPETLVSQAFSAIFGQAPFRLTEDTIFAFSPSIALDTEHRFSSARVLARALASAESYGRRRFLSLARQFGVSVEAMAIRLEELKLFSYS